jgi:hypothetical protein
MSEKYYIQVNHPDLICSDNYQTDSLARGIIKVITESYRYPNSEVELSDGNDHRLLGCYSNSNYRWQYQLDHLDWQRWIDYKLDKKEQARIRSNLYMETA